MAEIREAQLPSNASIHGLETPGPLQPAASPLYPQHPACPSHVDEMRRSRLLASDLALGSLLLLLELVPTRLPLFPSSLFSEEGRAGSTQSMYTPINRDRKVRDDKDAFSFSRETIPLLN